MGLSHRLQDSAVGGVGEEEGRAGQVREPRNDLDGLRGDEARDDGVGCGDGVDDVPCHALQQGTHDALRATLSSGAIPFPSIQGPPFPLGVFLL